MRQWMVFGLALMAVSIMIYAGFDALSKNQDNSGLFLTFVGFMTVIGLVIDFVNHLKARRIL